MEKNAKIGTFFYKERKRTQRSESSFEKNGCPTLLLGHIEPSGQEGPAAERVRPDPHLDPELLAGMGAQTTLS